MQDEDLTSRVLHQAQKLASFYAPARIPLACSSRQGIQYPQTVSVPLLLSHHMAHAECLGILPVLLQHHIFLSDPSTQESIWGTCLSQSALVTLGVYELTLVLESVLISAVFAGSLYARATCYTSRNCSQYLRSSSLQNFPQEITGDLYVSQGSQQLHWPTASPQMSIITLEEIKTWGERDEMQNSKGRLMLWYNGLSHCVWHWHWGVGVWRKILTVQAQPWLPWPSGESISEWKVSIFFLFVSLSFK